MCLCPAQTCRFTIHAEGNHADFPKLCTYCWLTFTLAAADRLKLSAVASSLQPVVSCKKKKICKEHDKISLDVSWCSVFFFFLTTWTAGQMSYGTLDCSCKWHISSAHAPIYFLNIECPKGAFDLLLLYFSQPDTLADSLPACYFGCDGKVLRG